MKPLCIYHGGCDDGFAAAWAIRLALESGNRMEVEFHPGVYQQEPPDVKHRHVIMVDFSYKRPVLEKMEREALSILILDHHKTARDDLAGLAAPPEFFMYRDMLRTPRVFGTFGLFDMERCGATMAHDYFLPGLTRPKFFDYIEDRDLWRKKLPGVDEFTMALRSYPQDFKVWDGLINRPAVELLESGMDIHRYYRTLIEGAKAHAYRLMIDGHRIPAVNASLFMASELAGELAQDEPFAAVYAESYDKEQAKMVITVSLRSRADGLDVSEIAKKFGGGGHKNAAGFRVTRDDFRAFQGA